MIEFANKEFFSWNYILASTIEGGLEHTTEKFSE